MDVQQELKRVGESPQGSVRSAKRRGLIAGAAALAASVLTHQSTESVAALDGSSLIIGGYNTGTATTTLVHSAKDANNTIAFSVDALTGAVMGQTAIQGRCFNPNGVGVKRVRRSI